MDHTNAFELEFIISGMKVDIEFEEDFFTKEEEEDLSSFIQAMSKEMPIDKSYVECKQNKHKSTFMLESGWNSIRDILLDTEYVKFLHPSNHYVLVEAFMVMARCYLYECLSTKTQDITHVNIIIKDEPFDVVVCKDTSNEWKNYAGKWQDWKFGDNGKTLPESK